MSPHFRSLMTRQSSVAILAIFLCGCGPHSSSDSATGLLAQFGELSVRGTPWTVRVSEIDRKIHIIRNLTPGTCDMSPKSWEAKQGWFAFVENDKRVWAYDGVTDLFLDIIMPDEQGGAGVYGPSAFPCPVPNEVLARLSPAARKIVDSHGKQP